MDREKYLERQYRYNHSEKGRARWNHYKKSPKGRAADAKYKRSANGYLTNYAEAVRRRIASKTEKIQELEAMLRALTQVNR